MCGRFARSRDPEVYAQHFGEFSETRIPLVPPSFNVAPSQRLLAVRATSDGPRELVVLRWGLVPAWAKDPTIGGKLINARAETADTKPSFRQAFKARRCLIAADGFYEWEKPSRQPWYISPKDGNPWGFAGLWERWRGPDEVVETCTILTTEANDVVAPIHDRMPVIVAPGRYTEWLDPEIHDRTALEALLRPYPSPDTAVWRVSRRVNSPRVDEASLVAPA